MSARLLPATGSRWLFAFACSVALISSSLVNAQEETPSENADSAEISTVAEINETLPADSDTDSQPELKSEAPAEGISMEFDAEVENAETEEEMVTEAQEPEGSISDEIEDLKQELLELNRDLFILEEELLYPANSQLALYLSMDVGEFFELDSVKVHLDGKLIASELYSDHQVDALFRGGVQRLYLGNLKTGEHTLTAFFIGIGPNEREYKRAAEVVIDKRTSGKVYELKIKDSTAKLQPVFEVKEWLL